MGNRGRLACSLIGWFGVGTTEKTDQHGELGLACLAGSGGERGKVSVPISNDQLTCVLGG